MSGKKDQLEVIDKENLALHMYLYEGKTFKTIAEAIGYQNASSAQKAYKRALARHERPNTDEYRIVALSRLNSVVDAYIEPVLNGDQKKAPVLLQALRDMSELLGLNAPIKIQQEVMNYDGNRSLSSQVDQLARVIEYIEGSAANITSIAEQPREGEQIDMEPTSPEGAESA